MYGVLIAVSIIAVIVGLAITILSVKGGSSKPWPQGSLTEKLANRLREDIWRRP
jgi:hypothetical protein